MSAPKYRPLAPGLLDFHELCSELTQLDLAGGVRLGKYAATVFEGPKKNIVFNATTIFWSQGLSDPPGHMIPWSHYSRPHGPDERVQRITANALKRALA